MLQFFNHGCPRVSAQQGGIVREAFSEIIFLANIGENPTALHDQLFAKYRNVIQQDNNMSEVICFKCYTHLYF